MRKETAKYNIGDMVFHGFLAYDEANTSKRPAVVVAHAWRGQDDFARNKAEELAKLGYIGFAVDLYGNGKSTDNNDEAAKLMMPLFIDRKTLRERIVAAYRTVAAHPLCDANHIGAIGFCFGGLAALELSRSGEKLKGVVSFHALLGNTLGDVKAETVAPNEKRQGAVLILHGYKDPLVSREDIAAMQKELGDAGLDWQMHIYGNASHAFTNPEAKDPASGLLYNQTAEKRSWQSMRNFFKEVFV